MIPINPVDLHVHSLYSDGTVSPTALVGTAKKIGLSAIALTDHDTIDGIDEFLQAGKKYEIETIPGIEFAVFYNQNLELHIIGLFINPKSQELLSCLDFVKNARENRNIHMAEKITALGFPITYEEVKAEAGGEIITRAHFARLMLKKKYISNYQEAFSKYISPGKPGYAERETLTPEVCIQTIHQAGGYAILAHPTLYYLDYLQIFNLCKELIPLGLDGIETYYSTYTKKQQKQICSIASFLHLKQSGGSDFHGANKPNIQLGTGTGGLAIPYSILEMLRK